MRTASAWTKRTRNLTTVAPELEPSLDIAALYKRYAPMVLRRVRRFYRGPEAEEVMQEVFLKVVEKYRSFRKESSPVTWLYHVTTNHCITRLRKQKRRAELMNEHSDAFQPSDTQARQEHSVFVRELWQGLDEELAQLGCYYYVDGMTHAEIARIAGVSPRTVGGRLETLRVLLHARVARGGA
jgi:RNA polymerase sigma factor (sigma-70 family)